MQVTIPTSLCEVHKSGQEIDPSDVAHISLLQCLKFRKIAQLIGWSGCRLKTSLHMRVSCCRRRIGDFVKLKVKMTAFSIVLGGHRDKNSSDFVFDHASDSMRAANMMTLTETKIIVANIDRLLSKTSRT